MAVFRSERNDVTYYGLAADTKPTDSSVPKGAIFWATDTGVRWVWSGAAWVSLHVVA